MSSNYRVLCLSHDPALEVDAEWQVRAYAVDVVTSKRDSVLADHAECDLLLARYSGGLVEVGCPAHIYHREVEWVDADWLRLAVAVAALPEPPTRGVKRSLDRVIGRCWKRVRLQRLWRLMVGEHFGIEVAPTSTPVAADADQCAASIPTDGASACPVNRGFHRCSYRASNHIRHRCECRAEFETARGVITADNPGVEIGCCALCGQELIRTADDCWHPYTVERACPPEPADASALADWYAAGNRTGRPGREHLVPVGREHLGWARS